MTSAESRLPVGLLHELMSFDASSGILTWKHRKPSHFNGTKTRSVEHSCANWNSKYALTPALASIDGSGHLTGRIFNDLFYAHRVVFAMATGAWPAYSIDHINGKTADNGLTNLRDVPHIENMRNQSRSKNNSSGVTGVCFNARLQKWMAHIGVRGKYVHLGFHQQKEQAIAARKNAEVQHGFHINHGRGAS